MKKNLLFSVALFASVVANAQTIVWPCTVNRETKEANVSATVTGGVDIKADDIAAVGDLTMQLADGVPALVAVKNTEGADYGFPDATYSMIGWQPTTGGFKSADLAEEGGCYIDFKVVENEITADLAGLTTIEFDVTKVGTDGVRMNCKLLGAGDSDIDSGWLINEENAYTFGDEYAGTEGGKDDPWDNDKNGYNPSRNDGSKGADTGANANGVSHVTLTIPESVKALNPYEYTLRVVAIDCANNKQLGLYNVTLTSAAGGETGINVVKPAESTNGVMYNLAGQQVDDTYKGDVIQNGKKSIQK